MNSFNQLIEASLNAKESKEVECGFAHSINGRKCTVYGASVANRDVLLFTDIGTATYLIDSYGDAHTAELFDWHFEGETE